MNDHAKWKTFEELVAAIEAEAAPRGAVVKSPDRIRDILTSQMREVDASIRFRAGTAEILITIECRRRNRKADDTWIEQLVTKKQKLGAARTIAVSATGFTKAAIASAKHHGIELRKLSEINSQDVSDWFLPRGIVHLFRLVENVRCAIRLKGSDQYTDIPSDMDPCFFHDSVHTPFPPAAFVTFLEMTEPGRFCSVPLDGTKTRMQFELNATSPNLIPVPLGVLPPEHSQLRVRLGTTMEVVEDIKLSFDLSYEHASFASNEGTHHLYEGMDGPLAQHSRFKGEVFGLPVTFDHQLTAINNSSASVQFPSGVRLHSNWVGVPLNLLNAMRDSERNEPVSGICQLCQTESLLDVRPVLPNYLLPNEIAIPHEPLLCGCCSEKISVLDEYGKRVLAIFPTDVKEAEGHVLIIDHGDQHTLRLWLLSVMWRMSVATHHTWKDVDLGSDNEEIEALLKKAGAGLATRYHVGLIVPSFDGQRLDFWFQPDCVNCSDGPFVRAAFMGFLFMLSVTDGSKEPEANSGFVRPGHPWSVPVIRWDEIDFLRHSIEQLLKQEQEGHVSE